MTYLTRAVFAFASLLLLLAAMALIGFGVKDALQGIGSPDKSGADAVLDVLGYVIVAIAVVFLGGFLASDDTPSTSVNSFNADNGFVKGSVDYGTRDNAGVRN